MLKHRYLPEGVAYRLCRKAAIRLKKSELMEDFAQRTIAEYHDKTEEYYHEELVRKDISRINRHIDFLEKIAKDIALTIQNNLFFRNCGSCFKYNKPCSYMSLCNTYTDDDYWSLANMKYSYRRPHEELSENLIT